MSFQRVSLFLSLCLAPAFTYGSVGPKRVVTLAPSLAEIAAEILEPAEWARIVGVSEFTVEPVELAGRPKVGAFYRTNLERVVSLKPDLVLATRDGNSKDQVERLQSLGITVVTVDSHSLKQVEESMREIGRALGEAQRGEQAAGLFVKKLEKLRVQSRNRAPARVVIQLGATPLVVAGQSFVSEAVEVLGLKNVFSDWSGYPKPSLEEVLRRKPDAVIVLGDHAVPDVVGSRVKVVRLKNDALLRPSPALISGLTDLRRLLQ